jgi:hypothetical protein
MVDFQVKSMPGAQWRVHRLEKRALVILSSVLAADEPLLPSS